MEKNDPDDGKEYKIHAGKTGSSLRDFRFRVPPKPIQYGIMKRISDRVLATTSENIRINDEPDEHPSRGPDLVSITQSLEAKDEEDEFMEMKTLCIDKKSVKMPSNEEHKFLKFCGLGLKSWQCPIDYTQADFRAAILSIYPRMASVIGFTVWTLTENMKILERIPDEKTTPQELVQFQQKHRTDILIIVPSTNIFLMEEKREYLSKIDNEKTLPDSVPTSSIERYHCLVCGTGENPGNASDFYRINKDQIPQWNKKQTIQEKLEEILGIDFGQGPILSDRMCPKCFKYISWIDKKEEQLKRSRSLLSNAFHATNSKLNISHVSHGHKRAKPSVIAETLNFIHTKTAEMGRPISPEAEDLCVTRRSQFAHRNYHIIDRSPSQRLKLSMSPKPFPTAMPSSTFIPTHPGPYLNISTNTKMMTDSSNYTSGYESSYSQSDIHIRSPELARKSAIYDSQADSCFESDTNYQPSESPKLYRRWDASPIGDFVEKPSLNEESSPENVLKQRQHPDLCWEVINSRDLKSSKKVPLKKRNLSHEYHQPAEIDGASQVTKRKILSYPNL